MELYTTDGLCVQRTACGVDGADAALGPAEGPLLTSLYRLFLRLHHAGDDTIPQRGTLALRGLAASSAPDSSSLPGARMDPSSPHAWSPSAAGTGAALGTAAAYASYPFFLLPQPSPSPAPPPHAGTKSEWSPTGTTVAHQDHRSWSSAVPAGSAVTSAAHTWNTNGAAKDVDGIPVRLSMVTLCRSSGVRHDDDEENERHLPDGRITVAVSSLAVPVLQMQFTRRVLECAPVVLPESRGSDISAVHAQEDRESLAQGDVTPTLLLCCTATKACEDRNHGGR